MTWVVVEEVAGGDWGIGGKPLSTDGVKALAAGVPAWIRLRITVAAVAAANDNRVSAASSVTALGVARRVRPVIRAGPRGGLSQSERQVV